MHASTLTHYDFDTPLPSKINKLEEDITSVELTDIITPLSDITTAENWNALSSIKTNIDLNEFCNKLADISAPIEFTYIRKPSLNAMKHLGIQADHLMLILHFEAVWCMCERVKEGTKCLFPEQGKLLYRDILVMAFKVGSDRHGTYGLEESKLFSSRLTTFVYEKYNLGILDYQKGYHPCIWNCEHFLPDVLNAFGTNYLYKQQPQIESARLRENTISFKAIMKVYVSAKSKDVEAKYKCLDSDLSDDEVDGVQIHPAHYDVCRDGENEVKICFNR